MALVATCEYTCDNFTPLPLGVCATPTKVDECVCAPGYVRTPEDECRKVDDCDMKCYLEDGSVSDACHIIGYVTLAAIVVISVSVPCHVAKSLQHV